MIFMLSSKKNSINSKQDLKLHSNTMSIGRYHSFNSTFSVSAYIFYIALIYVDIVASPMPTTQK